MEVEPLEPNVELIVYTNPCSEGRRLILEHTEFVRLSSFWNSVQNWDQLRIPKRGRFLFRTVPLLGGYDLFLHAYIYHIFYAKYSASIRTGLCDKDQTQAVSQQENTQESESIDSRNM